MLLVLVASLVSVCGAPPPPPRAAPPPRAPRAPRDPVSNVRLLVPIRLDHEHTLADTPRHTHTHSADHRPYTHHYTTESEERDDDDNVAWLHRLDGRLHALDIKHRLHSTELDSRAGEHSHSRHGNTWLGDILHRVRDTSRHTWLKDLNNELSDGGTQNERLNYLKNKLHDGDNADSWLSKLTDSDDSWLHALDDDLHYSDNPDNLLYAFHGQHTPRHRGHSETRAKDDSSGVQPGGASVAGVDADGAFSEIPSEEFTIQADDAPPKIVKKDLSALPYTNQIMLQSVCGSEPAGGEVAEPCGLCCAINRLVSEAEPPPAAVWSPAGAAAAPPAPARLDSLEPLDVNTLVSEPGPDTLLERFRASSASGVTPGGSVVSLVSVPGSGGSLHVVLPSASLSSVLGWRRDWQALDWPHAGPQPHV